MFIADDGVNRPRFKENSQVFPGNCLRQILARDSMSENHDRIVISIVNIEEFESLEWIWEKESEEFLIIREGGLLKNHSRNLRIHTRVL